ncbi:MAG: S-layer homology domain-containing protein [Candidatus Peribacteraceae bacterium]|nr:S-layer homology domain-containing protein [Candidatus Peribacteraceae bacterium]
MSHRRLRLNAMCLFLAVGSFALLTSDAYAKPILRGLYEKHDFDSSIKQVLGYEIGSILYFSELGTITTDEKAIRNTFESIGCYPFYFLKDGERKEAGYDCQTFFCVGYFSGSKQCRDNDNKPYGGVVEISDRLDSAAKGTVDISFPLFSSLGSDLPTPWKDRMTLLPSSCSPYFIAEWDVIAGDGYACTEVGHYVPTSESYSPKYDCRKMWTGAKSVLDSTQYSYQNSDGYFCDTRVTDHDFKIRENILASRTSGEQTPQDFLNEAEKIYSDAAARSSSAAKQTESSNPPDASPFQDVEFGDYGFEEIIALQKRGVIQGYDDATYKPQRTINRAELNKLLIAGLHSDEARNETDCFPDVKKEWFSTYVCAAKRLGWVSGYDNGTFMPSNTVNRAEAIKIVVSSLTQNFDSSVSLPNDVGESSWYAKYVRKAVELGIIIEPQFRPNESLTRAEIAVWVFRATQ